MNRVAIAGVTSVDPRACRVEVDEYVPLSFRSYEGVLGVRYVRFGDFVNSLLELQVDPTSLAVRGFTLTAFEATHEARAVGSMSTLQGLPVLSVSDGNEFVGPRGAQRVDIPVNFSIALGAGFLEIDLGQLSMAVRMIKSGPAEFYADAQSLVGLRVVGLTSQQMDLLEGHRRAKTVR